MLCTYDGGPETGMISPRTRANHDTLPHARKSRHIPRTQRFE